MGGLTLSDLRYGRDAWLRGVCGRGDVNFGAGLLILYTSAFDVRSVRN